MLFRHSLCCGQPGRFRGGTEWAGAWMVSCCVVLNVSPRPYWGKLMASLILSEEHRPSPVSGCPVDTTSENVKAWRQSMANVLGVLLNVL